VIVSVPASAQDLATTLTGQQKIEYLKDAIEDIQTRIDAGSVLTVGSVGYAAIGGVITDDALNDGVIAQAELDAYLEARDLVMTHDYAIAQTAEQLFMQEHAAAMVNLSAAVDTLTAATNVIATATAIAIQADAADTKPEQVALQNMLSTDAGSIDATEVAEYNDAIAAVQEYAQAAGAFMAAANNNELTASIDSYASQGSFMVGSYTAITYTQSVDEFVITWADAGFEAGFQGYLTPDMKTAEDVYGAGEYINLYGGYPTQ
jgi:hypothetical protein